MKRPYKPQTAHETCALMILVVVAGAGVAVDPVHSELRSSSSVAIHLGRHQRGSDGIPSEPGEGRRPLVTRRRQTLDQSAAPLAPRMTRLEAAGLIPIQGRTFGRSAEPA
jgi:hypothetical protein